MATDDGQGELNFDPPPSLIQPELTRAVTEDAIYRATFLTSEDRKQIYFEAIEAAARKYRYFCADEVWEMLGQVGDDERDNGSGMGPVLRMAVTAGIMERTGQTRRSRRPPSHGKWLPIYKSLLWTEAGCTQPPRMKESRERATVSADARGEAV